MSAGETLLAVKFVLEMPNNPVPEPKVVCARIRGEERVEQDIQRDHLPMPVDVVSYLPANAPTGPHNPDALLDDHSLELQVVFNRDDLFVFLPHVVRRGSDDKLDRSVGDFAQ